METTLADLRWIFVLLVICGFAGMIQYIRAAQDAYDKVENAPPGVLFSLAGITTIINFILYLGSYSLNPVQITTDQVVGTTVTVVAIYLFAAMLFAPKPVNSRF